MMQNPKKYIIGTIAVFILLFMILIRAAVWGEFIENRLNEKLFSRGWNIDVGNSSGTLFGTVYLNDITINHQDGQQIYISKSSINFSYIQSFLREITFDILSVEDFSAEINKDWFILDSTKQSIKSFNIPFNVRSFFTSGKIGVVVNEQPLHMSLQIGGELIGGLEPTLKCDLLKYTSEDNPDLKAVFRRLNLGYDGSSFKLNNVLGEVMGFPIKGEMVFIPSEPKLSGNINVVGIEIPDELFSKIPLHTKFSTFKGNFDFESNLQYFTGKLVLENELGLDMSGEFSVGKEKTAWVLKNFQLEGEESKLDMNGIWQNGKQVSYYMNLQNLDLSRWMKGQPPTQLSGLAILDAGLSQQGSFDQIDLTLEVNESKFFEQGEISIHGQLTYQDSILSTVDPVVVMVGNSFLTIDGSGSFKDRTIDLLADMENAEIDLVNRFLPGDFVSGTATGKLRIKGDYYSPSVNAELICNNINIEDFHLVSVDFNSKMDVNDTLTTGFVDLTIGKGTWRDRSFDSGTVNAIVQNSEIIVENCHFKSGKDFLQISGKYNGDDHYLIQRLQLAYEDNYLVNSIPISFSFQDSILVVPPFELHINDGMMEGVITGGNEPEARFKMSNFEAEILTQFIKDKRLQVSGIIFGEIWMQLVNGELDVDADLSLKKGHYMEESFDEMTLSFLYKNGMLHMDDISMTKGNVMGLQANGVIPFGKRQIGKAPISLKSTFSNVSLGFFHNFIPEFFTIGGALSGSFHLKGFPNKTQFTYDLDVINGLFDKIKLGHVTSIGSYNGRRLMVDSAKSILNDGIINASGSVPFDFNISSPTIGQFFPGDSINFQANAIVKSLPFLSPYIEDLDSVRGDLDIELSLTGPVESIQRNGYLKVKDGEIYTLLVSDPATGVEGEAIMNQNQLSIKVLRATLYHSNGKYTKPKHWNTSISGEMDFSQFFNPKYDLQIKGDETSFKTLYLDIVGQSNLDLTIVGKDTITVAGIIEALDANIFYEFTTEEMGTSLPKEQGTVMSYQLTIPIRESVLFQNSQIDAKVIGELSLSQIGHNEIDFGGELFVEDGNVFSYKDNFNELQGYVSFDNKGFNPFIDVNAFTMIDDEKINLRIMGGIDDLDIILESRSGFSESDILELLTWGKRFEDQELTSIGFGNQTVSILGSLLENQLEKNLKDSEFGKLGLVDDIAISGAAGLFQGSDEDFEVTAKRKIGDKTFLNLSYKRSFSLTNPNKSQIGVEYKLNRHFSVVGNIDEDGNLNLKYRYRYAY
jgi:hypothetical protein